MKTVVFSNNKGGCGKTTVALNVGICLAAKGYDVLAVDLDQQGNLSAALGADLNALDDKASQMYRRTSYRMLLDENGDYSQYIINGVRPRLDLIPAVLDDDAEALLDYQAVSRELLLRERLAPAGRKYDYCVIDTPPSLRTPTLNALAVSDLTVVPINPGSFSLVGISQVLRKIAKVRKTHQPSMLVMALSTMYVERQTLDRDTRESVIEKLTEDYVFLTTIPRLQSIPQASNIGQSVVETAPESPGAFAFRQLIKEIEKVLGDEQETTTTTKRKPR
jgi:chromosome partitioning protein